MTLYEKELIRRSQTGDWDAFELLLDRHRSALARTAYLVTRDRESVQDVVQEALIQIWRDLPSYRPFGSFRGWMMKILLNKARKHYRKRVVETVALETAAGIPDNDRSPEEAAELEEAARHMRQALECLTENHREVLILRYYSEFTIPEIAKVLGLREGTVKSRLSRALDRLQQALTDPEAHGRGGKKR
ncbi:MAG: RNA polymerase sigma factor [Dehalococcoidia bacterium]|nr:RNA polymerase sigma factor [Dehalococcoidia bacterium]